MRIVRQLAVFIIVLTGLALCSPMVRADPAGLPLLPAQRHAEWTAIGRLNIAGFRARRSCTGTLVAPQWVLTAAHCLRQHGGQTEPPGNIHFVAGWMQGTFVWHGRAASIHLHPNAARGPKGDIALVRLHAPAPHDILTPIPLDTSLRGTDRPHAIIGYQSTRSAMLSAAFDCPVSQTHGQVHIVNCSVLPGLSGSPALTQYDTGWRISAVVSARIEHGGHAQALVVAPGQWAFDTINQSP